MGLSSFHLVIALSPQHLFLQLFDEDLLLAFPVSLMKSVPGLFHLRVHSHGSTPDIPVPKVISDPVAVLRLYFLHIDGSEMVALSGVE